MKFSSEKIEKIYASKVATKYEHSMPPFFLKWKRKAINESSLKKGDQVLVFCCGTGLDFPYILEKIGTEGKIVGVDFSKEMLKSAQQKIEKEKWNNIELIEADITKFKYDSVDNFDAGVCTLGLSIIPDFKTAYHNLFNHVKSGGELIVGDMQLAKGLLAIFNPITIAMAKKFGGSHEGHKNSLLLQGMMIHDLSQIRKRIYFFGAYYYNIGKK